MKKYHVYEDESVHEKKIIHKLKQLKDVLQFVDDVSIKCNTTQCCTQYKLIRDAIDYVYTASERASEEIQKEINKIEDLMEHYADAQQHALSEVDLEFKQSLDFLAK